MGQIEVDGVRIPLPTGPSGHHNVLQSTWLQMHNNSSDTDEYIQANAAVASTPKTPRTQGRTIAPTSSQRKKKALGKRKSFTSFYADVSGVSDDSDKGTR